MAHDAAYLVGKNKCFVEGYSKEQMEEGDFTAGNALKVNGKEESQLDVHSAESAAYAAEAGYLRYAGFTTGTIDGTNGFETAILREGWTYLCIVNRCTYIFSIPVFKDLEPSVVTAVVYSNLGVSEGLGTTITPCYLDVRYSLDENPHVIYFRYQDGNGTWKNSNEQLDITILSIVRTTSQNV